MKIHFFFEEKRETERELGKQHITFNPISSDYFIHSTGRMNIGAENCYD